MISLLIVESIPHPHSPEKEIDLGQLRGLRFKAQRGFGKGSGPSSTAGGEGGWEEGAQQWKGSHLLSEAPTSQVRHLNSLQDAIFLSRIHVCIAVISQHLGKGVQVQTFCITLCWVSVEL